MLFLVLRRNAVSTIHGILDNKKDQEKKIFVIDAGLTKDSNLSFKKEITT